MTIVEAWQLWPLWRLLVWAAIGTTLLALAFPAPTSQPQAAMPPLPPPSYQPPQLPTAPAPPPAAAQVATTPGSPAKEAVDRQPVPSLKPVSRPELDASDRPEAEPGLAPQPRAELRSIVVSQPPALAPRAGLDGVAPSSAMPGLQPRSDLTGIAVDTSGDGAGLAPGAHAELSGVALTATAPAGPRPRTDLGEITINPQAGALAPAAHPDPGTPSNPP